MQKIVPIICLKISDKLITALRDMGEYESFCQFYIYYVQCHPINKAKSVSSTTILNLYFNTKHLFTK